MEDANVNALLMFLLKSAMNIELLNSEIAFCKTKLFLVWFNLRSWSLPIFKSTCLQRIVSKIFIF